MRILVSTSTFPLHAGDGTPRFVQDLCRALASHCEVTVLAPDAPGAAARERLEGVEVRRFRYFLPRRAQRLAYGAGMPDNLRQSSLAKLQAAPYLLAQAAATRRLCESQRIDVVNSHWIVPQGLSAALARGRRGRFRHVVTLHGGDAYLLQRLPFGRALARAIVARSDALIAVSSNVRDQLDRTLGESSGARIQPVGVHTRDFADGPRADSPFPDGFLLFVGRLIRIKGVESLLRALPRVREQHPGLGLVVIGDGPLLGALREQVATLHLGDAVAFPGRRSREEVAAHLRGCRALVVPSIPDRDGREEGMPAVVGEALAAGARVVASRSGGIPDVLHHRENGWLAEAGDPEDLARQIVAALATPPASAIDRAAAESARALDWSRVALAYLAAFGANTDS